MVSGRLPGKEREVMELRIEDPELTQEEKDQKIQNATEYYKSTTKAKPGSLASKAQMVQQYNDKHAKKK